MVGSSPSRVFTARGHDPGGAGTGWVLSRAYLRRGISAAEVLEEGVDGPGASPAGVLGRVIRHGRVASWARNDAAECSREGAGRLTAKVLSALGA